MVYPSVVNVVCVLPGCAFVTFCSKGSAELAQQELHDKTVLPNVRADLVYPNPY